MTVQDRTATQSSAAQVVSMPRSTDAIGDSLRSIFGHDHLLSPDMLRMLQSLDHISIN